MSLTLSLDALQVVHFVFLVLAVWRLTDAVLYDRAFAWLQRRGFYITSCPRCLSVWVAAILVGVYLIPGPWWRFVYWPLALSWLFLWKGPKRTE